MANRNITRGNTRPVDDDPTASAWTAYQERAQSERDAHEALMTAAREQQAAERAAARNTPEARALAKQRAGWEQRSLDAQARAQQALHRGDGLERAAGIRGSIRAKAGLAACVPANHNGTI